MMCDGGRSDEDSDIDHAEGTILTTVIGQKEAVVKSPASRALASPSSKPLLLRMSSLCVRPPSSNAVLISNLSLELREGESLFITGESGCGKSSLLRAISGIWSRGSGSIERCSLDDCYMLPQQPYICRASLRANAVYPATPDVHGITSLGNDDAEIRQVFGDIGLGELVQKYGLDAEVDLDDVLSGGERQKLGFARLSLRPRIRLVLLDESTSAMDEASEAVAYELLRRHVPSFISVGHRQQLERFHTHKLLLEKRPTGAVGRIVKLR